MEQKRNYQRELEKILEQIKEEGKVPTLFLHSCCAPCSSYVLEYLSKYFAITVFYYNPNISPREEYAARTEEVARLIREMPAEHPIRFVEGNYDPEEFYRAVKGHEEDREGGERCTRCFELRLSEAARLAAEGGFDWFTTTLTISPLKDAARLNAIGEAMGSRYGVSFLNSDFKKKNGYKRSIELSAQYGLYRQNYCGCVFSRREAMEREAGRLSPAGEEPHPGGRISDLHQSGSGKRGEAMYRLCIFDLDGTLLNTIGALTYATNRTLETFGLGSITPEQTRQIVGDGYRTQMERALKLAGDPELTHYEEALPVYMDYFSRYCMKDVVPYEGILQLLEFLKKQGIRIAVFSNKPHRQAVENIETIFGAGYFDAIRGEQAGTPKKPAPDGALLLCRELGERPEDCLYLGDTGTDMKTGLAAGMDTVGVLWGFRGREELEQFHPGYLVSDPLQVEEIAVGGRK